MKRYLIPLFTSIILPIHAEVDPKIHKMCIQAKDYLGCVKAMAGPDNTSEKNITVDLDKIRTTGNSCPDGFAYKGAGYCQEIKCFAGGKHDPRLAGKGHKCIGRPMFGRFTMHFMGSTLRASTTEACPPFEPEIGRLNSCQNGFSEEELINGYSRFIPRESGTKVDTVGFYMEPQTGKIMHIFSNSSADINGLKVGDYVIEAAGRTPPFLQKFERKPGDKDVYVIKRGNEEFRRTLITENLLIPKGTVIVWRPDVKPVPLIKENKKTGVHPNCISGKWGERHPKCK